MRFRLLLAAALAAAGARASDVSDQLSVNNTQATSTNPRSGNVSDNLGLDLDLSDKWSFNAGMTVTAESATPAASKGQFGTSGSVLTNFSAGVDWDATDNWSAGLSLDYSPQSTQDVGTDVSFTDAKGATVTGQALVQSITSQVDGGFDVSYDTAGDSNLEWDFTAGLTGTHQGIDQAITRAHVGTLTLAQIEALCASQPKRKICAALLRSQTAVSLDSEKLSLGATATAYRDTDLTLSVDLYHYEQDPASVAYPSLAAAHLGTGIPIAPLEYLVRSEVLHRWGDFQARLWVQAGKYEPGTGGDNTKAIGVKLQYKFTKTFKMWLSASGQSDLDAPDPGPPILPGQVSKSGTIAVGGQYRF